MNVNHESEQYGQIVPWDSLTDAERASGDWLKLPASDENGQPVQAKRVNPLEALFGPPRQFDPNELLRTAVSRSVPPGELHAVHDGRVVAKIINLGE